MTKRKLYTIIQTYGIYEDYEEEIIAIVSSLTRAQEIAKNAKQIGNESNDIIAKVFELDGGKVEFSAAEINTYDVGKCRLANYSKHRIILKSFDEIEND